MHIAWVGEGRVNGVMGVWTGILGGFCKLIV